MIRGNDAATASCALPGSAGACCLTAGFPHLSVGQPRAHHIVQRVSRSANECSDPSVASCDSGPQSSASRFIRHVRVPLWYSEQKTVATAPSKIVTWVT